MQKAILTSAIQPPKYPDVPPFRAQNKAELVILTTKDFPIPRRYFVANGPLGVQWIQTYLKGGDTFGILTKEEICEYEGKCNFKKEALSMNKAKMSFL